MSEQCPTRTLEEKIADLKKKVVDRCTERIEAARKKPKEKEIVEDYSITSRFKKDHGL